MLIVLLHNYFLLVHYFSLSLAYVFFFFLISFLATLRHMEFPGQGSNPGQGVETYPAAVATPDPLTHCAGPGIESAS